MDTLAQPIFVFLVLIGSIYFTCRKRRFDYLALGYFSSFIYFLPLCFGYSRGGEPGTIMPFQESAFMIGSTLFALLVIFGEISTRLTISSATTREAESRAASKHRFSLAFLAFLSLLGLLGTAFNAGSLLMSPDKASMLESLSRFHVLMVFSSILGVVWSYTLQRLGYFFLFVVIIIFDVYLGFRVSAGIAFIALVTLGLAGQGKRRVVSVAWGNKFHALVVVAGVSFLFLYKRFYYFVKLGEWEIIADRIMDPSTYILAITKSEPFGTQSILNYVLRSDFTVDPSYLIVNAFQIIPFSNLLVGDVTSFNALFQPKLFPEISGAMAGNWWAEWYAGFSWIGIAIALMIYVNGLLLLSYMHFRFCKSTSVSVLIGVFGAFFAFYIHRNEITYFITLEKRVIWLWVFIVLTSTVLAEASKPSKNSRQIGSQGDAA